MRTPPAKGTLTNRFCCGKHFSGGGRGKNVSKILAIINISSRESTGKTLSVRKNIIGNINFSQTSRLNMDKFGVGNDNPDCRLAPFS